MRYEEVNLFSSINFTDTLMFFLFVQSSGPIATPSAGPRHIVENVVNKVELESEWAFPYKTVNKFMLHIATKSNVLRVPI